MSPNAARVSAWRSNGLVARGGKPIMPDDLRMNGFGPACRSQRLRFFRTQLDVARTVGIGRSAVCNIEIGKAWPSLTAFHRLCRALDLDPCEFVGPDRLDPTRFRP